MSNTLPGVSAKPGPRRRKVYCSMQGRTSFSNREIDNILLRILSEPAESAAEMPSGTDESVQMALLRRARVHGATVLLSAKLWKCPHLVESARQSIINAVVESTIKDEQLADSTSKIVHAFRQVGITALAYKGPALWRALGLSFPSKCSVDIDLLVLPKDRAGADLALRSLGYDCVERDLSEACYQSQELPLVDLHFSLLTVGGWGDALVTLLDRAWHNQSSVEIAGTRVPILGPTDTTLALILHAGCHHLCTDWASLHDIARCTTVWRDKVDWEYLLYAADLAGIRNALHCPLWLAAEHFGASVPEEALRRIRLPWYRKGLRKIALAGFEGRLPLDGSPGYRAWRIVWNLLSQPGFGRTVKWAVRRTWRYTETCQRVGEPH